MTKEIGIQSLVSDTGNAKKAKWVASRRTLGGYPCVELSVASVGEEPELALQLKRGEIHFHSAYLYGVSVYCHKAANRLIALLGLKKKKRKLGEELQFQMARDQSLLEKVVKALGGLANAKGLRVFTGENTARSAEIEAKTGDRPAGHTQGPTPAKNAKKGAQDAQ